MARLKDVLLIRFVSRAGAGRARRVAGVHGCDAVFAARAGKATGSLGAVNGALSESCWDRVSSFVLLCILLRIRLLILLIIGLGTRWAALYCLGNIFVAWAFVHHFAFAGKGPGSDHGELIVLYLGVLLTLLIAGPGAACLDRMLERKL